MTEKELKRWRELEISRLNAFVDENDRLCCRVVISVLDGVLDDT